MPKAVDGKQPEVAAPVEENSHEVLDQLFDAIIVKV